MKLAQKHIRRLGDLINDLEVAHIMLNAENTDTKLWLNAKYRAILSLYEEYGIENVNLDRAQEHFETQKALAEARASIAKAEREAKREELARQAELEADKRASERAEREAIGSSTNPEDYVCIALWGQELHSHAYYIEEQQLQASRDGAPVNALFKDSSGYWRTLDQMHNAQLKAKIEKQLEEEQVA